MKFSPAPSSRGITHFSSKSFSGNCVLYIETTFYFDEFSLTSAVNFFIDNCYFTLGSLVFCQIIGVPTGVDPGPYIANLT